MSLHVTALDSFDKFKAIFRALAPTFKNFNAFSFDSGDNFRFSGKNLNVACKYKNKKGGVRNTNQNFLAFRAKI